MFVARLLKRRLPHAEVVVHEQRHPDSTPGFGVGLAAGAQRRIAAVDPQVHAALRAASQESSGSAMRVPTGVVSVAGDGVVGISRLALVRELSRLAVEVGVQIRYGHRQSLTDLSAELVIAADGVHSAVRQQLRDHLRVSVEESEGLYLWCGADVPLEQAIFEPVTTRHGTFTLHAYPYTDTRSTFLVETDQQTWHNAGFDVTTQRTASQDSDQASLDYLSAAYAQTLDGRQLLGSATRWSRFQTVSCERWSQDNVVLIGDAAHTAHYSVGSGTKLAMEDAIALVDAVVGGDSLEQVFEAYEGGRRPAVESLQRAAHRSELWWDSFPERLGLPSQTLLVAYMTRTGRVDLDRLDALASPVVREALKAYAGEAPPTGEDLDLTEWVLERPFSKGRVHTARRVIEHEELDGVSVTLVQLELPSAWTTEADTLLTELVGHDLGLEVVCLCGTDTAKEVAVRMDFAERVKRAYPRACVVVEAPEPERAALAAGLVADRFDLVILTPADELDHPDMHLASLGETAGDMAS